MTYWLTGNGEQVHVVDEVDIHQDGYGHPFGPAATPAHTLQSLNTATTTQMTKRKNKVKHRNVPVSTYPYGMVSSMHLSMLQNCQKRFEFIEIFS